jgi:hypothetical protein
MVKNSRKKQNQIKKELNLEDDKDCEFDVSNLEEFRLPPKPEGLRDWSNEESKMRYKEDPSNIKLRVHHKLFSFWITWATLRQSVDIEALCCREAARDSDEYKAKSIIVDIIDRLGKILADTDIMQEMLFLVNDETPADATHQSTQPLTESCNEAQTAPSDATVQPDPPTPVDSVHSNESPAEVQ